MTALDVLFFHRRDVSPKAKRSILGATTNEAGAKTHQQTIGAPSEPVSGKESV
jgi:hypothetical protein